MSAFFTNAHNCSIFFFPTVWIFQRPPCLVMNAMFFLQPHRTEHAVHLQFHAFPARLMAARTSRPSGVEGSDQGQLITLARSRRRRQHRINSHERSRANKQPRRWKSAHACRKATSSDGQLTSRLRAGKDGKGNNFMPKCIREEFAGNTGKLFFFYNPDRLQQLPSPL